MRAITRCVVSMRGGEGESDTVDLDKHTWVFAEQRHGVA